MELIPSNEEIGPPTDQFGEVKNFSEDKSRPGAPPQASAATHARSDVDSSVIALHHTLGSNRNQSSPGTHTHDGTTSNKLGPMQFDTTVGQEGKIIPALSITGSRGGNAAVASIIALLGNFVNFKDNTTP